MPVHSASAALAAAEASFVWLAALGVAIVIGLVACIQQYLQKATSGHGYGHAILSLPHLLVVHLPEAGRAGVTHGWNSKEYREALQTVDGAMKSVLDLFKEYSLLDRTAVVVTAFSEKGTDPGAEAPTTDSPVVPWIVSGSGIKHGQLIRQPVSIIDTGATVIRILGLETHTEWESKAVKEIFQTTAATGSPPGPSDTLILSIHEDRQGILWVGTSVGGLNRLDRSAGSMTGFQHDPADPASIDPGEVTALYEDRSGTLWVGTSRGLSRFDPGLEVFESETALKGELVGDIAEGPHYAARGMIAEIVTRDGLTLKVPGVVPKLSATPGAIRTTAPRLGEDTEAVLRRLGYTAEQVAALRAEKVIG